MADARTILIVDDEASMRETLEMLLTGEGHNVITATSGEAALEQVNEHEVDLVITDMRMEAMSGVDLLRRLREGDEPVEVIVMTAYARAADAVEAMKLGAYDYLIKPFNLEELKVLVRRALEKRALGRENIRLKAQLAARRGPRGLVAESAGMANVMQLVQRVKDIDPIVLITGESGVGKEIVARTIHEEGARSGGPFVPVNCGALPENLIEAELFGYERGAFTGADRAKPGLLEQASGGTLFLDEIGELPAAAQVKLLRVLQEQTVRRLGGRKVRSLDTRFLAATNQDLEARVEEGAFREDLFYRLNVMRIHVPPLRERPEDIPVLARHFAEETSARLGFGYAELSPAALTLLASYEFPGNVRELANVIERAVILSRGGTVDVDLLPVEVRHEPVGATGEAVTELPRGFDVESYLANEEKRLFRLALAQAEGVKSRAAELLGLSFRQFRYKAKKYDL